MNKIIGLIKRFLFSFIILYGFNTIASNFDIVIPINFITLLVVTFLGFPGLFTLAILYVLILWGDLNVRYV